MLLRTFCIVLSVFLGSSFVSPLVFSSEADGGENGAAIWLEGYERAGGEVEIAVFLDSVYGVCGILFELVYDENEFLLLSVGAEECGLDLTHRDFGGLIVTLLDGTQNTKKECELVRFYFKRKNGGSGGGEFAIGEGIQAFGLRSNLLVKANVDVCEGRFCTNDIERDARGEIKLGSVSVRIGEDGETEFDLSLCFVGEAFALGAKLFIIDFGTDGECFEVLVSSVVPFCSERENLTVDFNVRGAFCVVITPILYMGNNAIAGEKLVAVVNLQEGEVIIEVN